MELAERPAVMSYYRTVPPPFGGEPPTSTTRNHYSLPPKGAGTSVASQLPCECRFLESVSWAVQPHFLSEILASGFLYSAPRQRNLLPVLRWGHRWKPLGLAITDCFTWFGPGQGASNHSERRIGTKYLYHMEAADRPNRRYFEV